MCQPCILAVFPEHYHALWTLMIRSLMPIGFEGKPIISVEQLRWKLTVNRIPECEWADIDEAVSEMFAEYMGGHKNVVFGVKDAELFGIKV